MRSLIPLSDHAALAYFLNEAAAMHFADVVAQGDAGMGHRRGSVL